MANEELMKELGYKAGGKRGRPVDPSSARQARLHKSGQSTHSDAGFTSFSSASDSGQSTDEGSFRGNAHLKERAAVLSKPGPFSSVANQHVSKWDEQDKKDPGMQRALQDNAKHMEDQPKTHSKGFWGGFHNAAPPSPQRLAETRKQASEHVKEQRNLGGLDMAGSNFHSPETSVKQHTGGPKPGQAGMSPKEDKWAKVAESHDEFAKPEGANYQPKYSSKAFNALAKSAADNFNKHDLAAAIADKRAYTYSSEGSTEGYSKEAEEHRAKAEKHRADFERLNKQHQALYGKPVDAKLED